MGHARVVRLRGRVTFPKLHAVSKAHNQNKTRSKDLKCCGKNSCLLINQLGLLIKYPKIVFSKETFS